jgi:ketosteroid isomerase-like protein
MSGKNVARQAVRASGRPRRTWEERLVVRVPAILRLVGPAIQRLPVRSRLRRALVRRRISQVYEASNRGDMEAFLVLGSHPAIELHTATDEAGVPFGVDLDDVYHGREGLVAFAQQWDAAWEQYRAEPEEVIDCGDKLVVFLRHRGRGKGSGVEIDQRFAQVLHLRNGQAVRIDTFWDHTDALEAVGLLE